MSNISIIGTGNMARAIGALAALQRFTGDHREPLARIAGEGEAQPAGLGG